jgi:hypothetical protein
MADGREELPSPPAFDEGSRALMQFMICASLSVSSPLLPFGGSARRQMGQISSSFKRGREGLGMGGVVPRSRKSGSNIELPRGLRPDAVIVWLRESNEEYRPCPNTEDP